VFSTHDRFWGPGPRQRGGKQGRGSSADGGNEDAPSHSYGWGESSSCASGRCLTSQAIRVLRNPHGPASVRGRGCFAFSLRHCRQRDRSRRRTHNARTHRTASQHAKKCGWFTGPAPATGFDRVEMKPRGAHRGRFGWPYHLSPQLLVGAEGPEPTTFRKGTIGAARYPYRGATQKEPLVRWVGNLWA
jgi:hypothetical protein